jgi:multidrug efflux pump
MTIMNEREALFATAPVGKALLSLALPTVASQLVITIYNLADTFWVGQLNDPDQIAVLAMMFPLQTMLTVIANLFGIGAGALIARYLAEKNLKKLRQASAVGAWGVVAAGGSFLLFMFFCRHVIYRVFGMPETLFDLTDQYLIWAMVVGGVPSMFNLTVANIIRGEGYAREAFIGVSLGGILNIFIDPFFVLPAFLNWELRGAAIATLLANVCGAAYLLRFLLRKRGVLSISFAPRHLAGSRAMVGRVVATGMPSALHQFLSAVSNAVLNDLLMAYGTEVEAAIGVAKKVDGIPLGCLAGLSQGVVPLLSYCYGAKNMDRFRESFRKSLISALVVVCIFLACVQIFAAPIARLFIDHAETVAYCAAFLRIHSTSMPFMVVTMLTISALQSTGNTRPAFWLSLVRKGTFDLPLMVFMNHIFRMYGVIACQPIMDVISATAAVMVFRRLRDKMADGSPASPS